MKNVQLFITHHYDAIKLFLLTICVALLAYIVLTNMAEQQQAKERGDAVVARAIKEINDKSDEQTNKIDRQFAALCVLIIETSGTKGLDKLDHESAERCRDLADGSTVEPPTTSIYTPPAQPDGNAYTPQDSEPVPSSPSQAPRGTPLEDTPDPRKPSEPNLLDSLLNRLPKLNF